MNLLKDPAIPTFAHQAPPLTSYPDGRPLEIAVDGATLLVRDLARSEISRWRLSDNAQGLKLERSGTHSSPPDELRVADLLAAIEAAFTLHPQRAELVLAAPATQVAEVAQLIAPGIVLPGQGDGVRVARDMFWQQARMWLPSTTAPYALQYTLTQGRRHPRRPPKPEGIVYQRHIPWLGKTFSFRTLELDQDLPRINRWMNDPLVAQVWQEEGGLAQHRAYLEAIAADPHMTSMIACFDGEPFGYFEVYWAKENRIAPFYDAHDFDRGWHVLIGEPSFRGKQFATAWLTSISHYLFLDDPRTQRVVGEPRADHERQIRNLDKSGYAKLKEFDFPHKRALLVMMLRERYFGDALWLPRNDGQHQPDPDRAAFPTAGN